MATILPSNAEDALRRLRRRPELQEEGRVGWQEPPWGRSRAHGFLYEAAPLDTRLTIFDLVNSHSCAYHRGVSNATLSTVPDIDATILDHAE
jgi:hypothetical protein